jgi:hypothetical protein
MVTPSSSPGDPASTKLPQTISLNNQSLLIVSKIISLQPVSHWGVSMIRFTTRILKFQKQGEKTGWSYIEISHAQAEKLKPGCRVSFRVKGMLDDYKIEKTALLPMGDGSFILPVNGTIRKAIGKQAGDKLTVAIELDERQLTISSDFLKCLKDDPRALTYFKSLPKGHQNYFSKWIDSAKTTVTKTKRITMAVIALGSGQGFPEMIRANKGQ